jgi:urease accessory protein
MKARAHLVVDGGQRVLRSEPPLALRAASDAVYLVSTSASPVGGDDVMLDVDVASGSSCTVRATAASIALPGVADDESYWTARVRIGRNARLHWRPEPLVAAARCRHVAAAYVDIAPGAIVTWRDELVLGRAGEEPGRCTTRFHVDRDGLPLVRHDIAVGPHARTIGVLGDARTIGTLLLVGVQLPSWRPSGEVEAEVFVLDDDVALLTVLGRNVADMRAALDGFEADALDRSSSPVAG